MSYTSVLYSRWKTTSLVTLGIILSTAVLYSAVSSASAWSAPESKCTSTLDQDLIAANGDVVTTNKWNDLVCHISFLGEIIYGGKTDRKQSVFNFHSNPANSLGSSVSEIRLPTISGSSTDPTVGGGIFFYDPVGSYKPENAKSAIASILDNGGWGGIGIASLTPNSTVHIYTKRDPIRDAGAAQNSLYGLDLRRHALAWEKVSTSDSASFDSKCQYRIVAGPGEGWVLYMSGVAPQFIRGQFNAVEFGTTNRDVSITVSGSSKNSYQVYDENGLVPTSSGVYGNGTITHLEKLCLPIYN